MRDLHTRVGAFGKWIEITTPADAPDAQEVHTRKFIKAMTELRRMEADRRKADGTYDFEYSIKPLLEPWKPVALKVKTLDPTNDRHVDWKPALPVDWWKPPKAPSVRQARINALKILGRDYVPTVWGGWPSATAVTRDMFDVTFEEITEE